MKRIFFFLMIAAAILTGCNENEPENGGTYTLSGNGNGDNTNNSPKADFTFTRISPLMVRFKNTSTGYISCKWDFGDGTYSTGTDAIHGFEKCGVEYPVTLTIRTSQNTNISKRYVIKLTKPDIWITGYTYYRVPIENRYYRLRFEDDKWGASDWDWTTVYSPMLNNSDLPYTYELQNPQKLINPEQYDKYTVYVYSNTSATGSGSDTKHLTISMKVSDIMTYQEELRYETQSSGATKVGILFGYEY